jgi:hypothetical protein
MNVDVKVLLQGRCKVSVFDRHRKSKKFRVPGRRLPPPSEFKLSDRVVEDKKPEDETIPLMGIVAKCDKCKRYFDDDEGTFTADGVFTCLGCGADVTS